MEKATAALRLSGRRVGLAALVHLVLFQLLSGALVTVMLLLFGLGDLPGVDEAAIYVASDAAMLIAGAVYLVCFIRNRHTVKAQTPAPNGIRPLALAGYAGLILGIKPDLSGLHLKIWFLLACRRCIQDFVKIRLQNTQRQTRLPLRR